MERTENPNAIVPVTFTLLGCTFSLKVRNSQKQNLLDAVRAVSENTSQSLRQNPNLGPLQAAILAALDAQSRLSGFVGTNTPFQDQAFSLIRRIDGVLKGDKGRA